jgi:hypothetical protein
MSRFFVSPDSPEGWKEGLAKPTHWKPGHSAQSLAYTWHPADGFHKVALPGGRTASQTDLVVLARTSAQDFTRS